MKPSAPCEPVNKEFRLFLFLIQAVILPIQNWCDVINDNLIHVITWFDLGISKICDLVP